MDVKATRKLSVFNRLGGQAEKNQVCVYWLSGKCNRNPCRFMHRESPPPPQTEYSNSASLEESHYIQSRKRTWRNPNYSSPTNSTDLTNGGARSKSTSIQQAQQKASVATGRKTDHVDQKKIITSTESISCQRSLQKNLTTEGDKSNSVQPQQRLCKYWVTDSCVHGDKCKDLHSWFCGSGFTMLTKLEGHRKTITGIALPSGSDKLFSSSTDRSIRVWDCNSGQCTCTVDFDGEVGCLITEGPWLIAGLPNTIKAWNLQAQTEFFLSGPVGQVHSLVMDNDMLFVGIEDGSILAWKICPDSNMPQLVATLKGHNSSVCTLVIGANRLYSGSRDSTVRAWDLGTLKCMQTLHGHTGDVTSVICWDRYLLSASLDNTLKVWTSNESGILEVVYEFKDEYGVIALCGIHDAEARPILLCAYKDNTVRLYDLPSFNERGRIFSKCEVQVIQIGIGGLFFTGDASGQVSVWKLLGVPSTTAS